jgi:hypothetical protein
MHPVATAARPVLHNQGLIREMLAMRFADKFRDAGATGRAGRLPSSPGGAPPRQLR